MAEQGRDERWADWADEQDAFGRLVFYARSCGDGRICQEILDQLLAVPK